MTSRKSQPLPCMLRLLTAMAAIMGLCNSPLSIVYTKSLHNRECSSGHKYFEVWGLLVLFLPPPAPGGMLKACSCAVRVPAVHHAVAILSLGCTLLLCRFLLRVGRAFLASLRASEAHEGPTASFRRILCPKERKSATHTYYVYGLKPWLGPSSVRREYVHPLGQDRALLMGHCTLTGSRRAEATNFASLRAWALNSTSRT